MRGDNHAFTSTGIATDFNPRPSVRGDLTRAFCAGYGLRFQSTPLREGRHAIIIIVASRCNFNPRPSVRGDEMGELIAEAYDISIHAPP